MDKRKIIYYENELTDEFSLAQITPKVIDGSWVYVHTSPWKKFTHFFWYRIVATPIAFAYVKAVFHQKTVGAEKFKPYRGTVYFMFANHTQDIGDAFLPNVINFPQTDYVIVHPNNVSMPFLGKVTPSLGALPLPGDLTATRNFMKAIEHHLKAGHAVVVYPEAHIWPFYTGIRPFPDTSFRYPVKHNVPSFCFTNTYQKRRFSKKPRIVTYVDGPFFPDESLPERERKEELRNRIYRTMCQRAENSTVEQIRYVRKGDPV